MPHSSSLHRPPGRPAGGRSIDDAFYSLAPWRRFREWYLARHPLCADPLSRHTGEYAPATDVDHITPRRERPDLSYSEGNCQALCHSCHAAKTQRGA